MIEPGSKPLLPQILGRLLARVDIASLVFFRIGFGALAAWWAWDYLATGRVRYYYIQPRFHFTYFPFDWVRPWLGAGMYLHFLALILLGLCIATGCCYRLACAIFAVGFAYVFLLDATLRPEFQMLTLAAHGGTRGTRQWYVDGAFVGAETADENVKWPLTRGRHDIVVRDGSGASANTQIEVR